jgi:hypothetical protein
VAREEVKGRNRETGNDSARRGNRESSRGRMRQGMIGVEVEWTGQGIQAGVEKGRE